MTKQQQRIDLFRKLKSKKLLKAEDNSDVTFFDYYDTYFGDQNGFEDLYNIVISELDIRDEDNNPMEKNYFYQNFACDLPWAKKNQYCIANKYSKKWSADSCVPTYAQENDGTITMDSSYKIGEKYYYPNGDVLNKSAQKIGTYQCVDGEPKFTSVAASTAPQQAEKTTWASCVTARKDIRYNENNTTATYTSSIENVGVVTLNLNGSFTATGSLYPNGGVWSCTNTGKIFLDYPTKTQQSSTTKPKFEWRKTSATPETITKGEIVKYGMTGDIVYQIQRMLANSGYGEFSKSGKPDGKFGNRTRNMVIKFQTDNGITPAQGNVGPKTWAKLTQTSTITPAEISAPKEFPTQQSQTEPIQSSESPQGQKENYMKNINNIIKENLVEAKEQKKKNLQETRIIDTRFKIIVESDKIKTKEDLDDVLIEILYEMVYLHNQGFEGNLIAESVDGVFGVLSNLFKGSSSSILDTFKERGVKYIMSHLGLSGNGFLENFLITAIGNTSLADVPKLFTDCNFLTKKIAESIPEAYLRKLEYEKGMGNIFMDAVRNSLYDVIRNSDFAHRIESGISGIICPLVEKMSGSFAKKLGTMKSSLIGNTQA